MSTAAHSSSPPPGGRQGSPFAANVSKILLVLLAALSTVLFMLTTQGGQGMPILSQQDGVSSSNPKSMLHPPTQVRPSPPRQQNDLRWRSRNVSASSSGSLLAPAFPLPVKLSQLDTAKPASPPSPPATTTTSKDKNGNRLRGHPHPSLPELGRKDPSPPSLSSNLTSHFFTQLNTISDSLLHHHYSCANQTLCYPSHLQLRRSYSVYYCKHTDYGVRFYFLVREGLLLHPHLHLTEDMFAADYIVYLPESAQWEKTECNNPAVLHKLIALDEGDQPHLFQDGLAAQIFLTFKRSYVKRANGVWKGYMRYLDNVNILPMTYPVAEAYLRPRSLPMEKRGLEIVCSLRGGKHDPTRQRVREFVDEYGKSRRIQNYVAGEVSSASRTTINTKYFGQMANARIIVTSNPSHWEGDFRFCEALGSGALIFIDEMFVPRPYPFLHNVHVVYYNSHNKTDLFDKLDFVRRNDKLLRQIATQGYIHALTHHRATNLLDYVFRTVHIKERAVKEKVWTELRENAQVILDEARWGYTEHGYAMRLQAKQNQQAYDQGRLGKGNGYPPLVLLR